MSISEPLRSANLLVDQILSNHELHQKLDKTDQEKIRELAAKITENLLPPAYLTDKVVNRLIVSTLGLVGLAAVRTTGYLATQAAGGPTTPQVPAALTAIGSAAIGALAGMLAPSPKG